MTGPIQNLWRSGSAFVAGTVARWAGNAAVVVVLFGMPVNAVSAGEFCVTCSEPFAMYRCAINDNGVLSAPAGAQLPCIRELARQGGHKSCSVRRDGPEECLGKLLVLAPGPDTQLPPDNPFDARARAQSENGGEDVATGAGGEGVATGEGGEGVATAEGGEEPAVAGEDGDVEEEPEGEPRTVVELANQTAKSSKKNLKKAGEAVVDAAKSTGGHIKNAGDYVGGTAKKTWDCISSLFFNCFD